MSDAVFAYRHRLVVRFRDCDSMGHVNNAVYFTYFEQCRLSWWKSLSGSPGFPGAATNIVHADCDYRAPAFVHDELEVRLTLAAIGRSSVTLKYQIVNLGTGRRVADGTSVNVAIDRDSGRPIPVPEPTRALLARPESSEP